MKGSLSGSRGRRKNKVKRAGEVEESAVDQVEEDESWIVRRRGLAAEGDLNTSAQDPRGSGVCQW